MNFPIPIATAIKASIAACDEIMEIYTQDFTIFTKSDESPLTQADLNSSAIINKMLSSTNIPIIGEENSNLPYEKRKHWAQCWIVDPLDGTKEFIKKNDEFAVCIALVEKGVATWGIIASPVEQKLWVGNKKTGLFEVFFGKNEQKTSKIEPELPKNKISKVLISRSHLSALTTQYLEQIKKKHVEIQYVSKGSALKFVDLALGEANFYPRFGPTMEWDVAAGQAILETAGGTVLDASTKTPLTYNKPLLTNSFFIAKNVGY